MFLTPDPPILVRRFRLESIFLYLLTFATTGKHWSAEKVANTFAPTKETHDGVVSWLVKAGIDASRHAHSTGTYICN